MKKYIVIAIILLLLLFTTFAVTQDHGVDWVVKGLKVTGAFLSLGIDDNADDIAITIDVATEKVNFSADVDVSGTFSIGGAAQESGAHGYMAFADSAQVLAMTTGNWAKVTQEADSLFSTYVNDGGAFLFQGDSIQVLSAGDVEINWEVSFSGANTDSYKGAIFINNTIQANRGQWRRDISGTDAGSASASFTYTATALDWISFRVVNTANGNDMTVITGNVQIDR